jgi:ATP-dependent DNA helicase RecQ
MVRTGERFGAGHIISLVMGKGTKRMRDLGHDGLPTFGVGRDQPEAYWRRVMDALLAQGLIIVRDPAFPTPSVSGAGWELLRGKRSCAIIRLAQKAEARSGRKTREEHPIFSLLRDERTRLAREAGVPPYVIFSDRALREMAERLPDTPERLLGVTGVGAHKLKNYGEAFLSLVRGWLDEHPEDACRADEGACPALPAGADKDKPAMARVAPAGRASGTESWRETGRLLDQGLSLEEAAEQRGLSLSTIHRHLGLLLSNGKQYSPYRFFTPARFSQIQRLYRETGDWRLTPVVELSLAAPLPEETAVSYDEARLARLFLRGPGQDGPSSEIGNGQDGA